MRAIRIILLVLYLTLLTGFLLIFLFDSEAVGISIVALVFVAGQVIFLATAGRKDLVRPIKRRRLIGPLIITILLFGCILFGLSMALSELFELDNEKHSVLTVVCTIAILATWVMWSIVLYLYTRRAGTFTAIKRMVAMLFVGSLAELIASVPSHLIVTRRPGCLVGIGTMAGIVTGGLVMAWSFGPGIMLLFLHDRYQKERDMPMCLVCGYDLRGSIAGGSTRCPECGCRVPAELQLKFGRKPSDKEGVKR